ncbi:MAG TPA: hypothetical protein VML55_03160, partial [Planctomycetaceae bacterium]|nr:hypothetical protein [Planctomycetaceae bacterium]
MPADPKQTHLAQQWQHTSPFITCRFDPQGRYVFATAEDRTIQRWTLADGTKLGYPAQETWIRGMAFLPDGETLITGGSEGRLVWWPVSGEKPEPIRTVDAHKDQWIRSVSVSPDGAFIATGGNDKLVKLWSAADGALVRVFEGHDSHVYSTLYHPGGQFVLSGDLSGKIHQWNVADGKLVRTFDASPLHSYNEGQQVHYGGVRSLALSPDGKRLAASGLDNASNPLG